METIAFYSYKGGVGRSLLLANVAKFLAERGDRVVAIDFDFEAPGLHYKFGRAEKVQQNIDRGVVPYLNLSLAGVTRLASHLISIPVKSRKGGWLKLMPAGPAPSREYWSALKSLGVHLRLDDPSGRGFMALLDLQARIAKEFNPDYLLIDARTGITELGGLATTILADSVVCVFTGSLESIDGTTVVVEALKAARTLSKGQTIRVVPVLSRVTAQMPGDPQFRSAWQRLIAITQMRFFAAFPQDATVDVSGDLFSTAFDGLGSVVALPREKPPRNYREFFQSVFPPRRSKTIKSSKSLATSDRRLNHPTATAEHSPEPADAVSPAHKHKRTSTK